jgi:putative heme-binding domain-containing protein
VVRLQALVALAKTPEADRVKMLTILKSLSDQGDDPTVKQVAWELLKPLVASSPALYVAELNVSRRENRTLPSEILERGAEVVLSAEDLPAETARDLLTVLLDAGPAASDVSTRSLERLTSAVQSRALRGPQLAALQKELSPLLGDLGKDSSPRSVRFAALTLAASWKDEAALAALKKDPSVASPSKESAAASIAALKALISGGDRESLALAERLLATGGLPKDQVLFALSRAEDAKVAQLVLAKYASLGPGMQPKAIDLLTERPQWGLALLNAIQSKSIPSSALNLNQVRRLSGFKDPAVQALFKDVYGSVRETRSPDRDRVIGNMKNLLDTVPGDPHAGAAVFKKVCGQCHKIYGEGADVGPDITSNGRNNWEQLLSNVLDPSLVIGKGYQARILATADGRVLTGLPVEENDKQVVLKVQGGKLETIPRSEIEAYKESELSMMPEALEKQLSSQELADLFAFLALDKPPGDASARQLCGSPRQKGK